YEKGWLDRFFDRLLATDWLALTTLSDVVDRVEATDRVYLPTASYREMGEWALPVAAQRRVERAKHDLERLGGGADHADLLRGGLREDAGAGGDAQPRARRRDHRAGLPRGRSRRGRRAGAPAGGIPCQGPRGEPRGRRAGGEDHPRRAGAQGSRARLAARLRR